MADSDQGKSSEEKTGDEKVTVEDVGEEEKEMEKEKGITMLDVLQDEEDLEQDANAVLGAADENNCTYPSGYMARQALYSCETCSVPHSPDFTPAGVCLACSYHCHEGHNLVELYTKRLFRCDCGTSRLASTTCTLNKSGPAKEDNVKNKYNQNFSGVYCVCARPYPDPEETEPDEMIQCIMCEDWYHGRHLGLEDGPLKGCDFSEMICVGCCGKYKFLSKYKGLCMNEKSSQKDGAGDSTSPQNNEVVDVTTVMKDGAGDTTNVKKCLLKSRPDGKEGTMFLSENWRDQLCRCEECLSMYKQLDVAFIIDPVDTVHHYEAQARESKGQFEQGMEALSQMDRIKQVEAIHSYNSMKEDLMQYLGKFAENGKVVREEDIREFFEKMKSNKKPRLGSAPPGTCK